MKVLQFTLDVTTTPWKCGQSKAPFAAIRLAMRCTGVSWYVAGKEVEANISKSIFAYLRVEDKYNFNHVCGAVDLLELSENEGGVWARKDYIDLIFPSIELALEGRCKIESDIRYLAHEIENYEKASEQETIEIS